MIGYGTWDVPAGTWSDDSSLTFCLAECLCNEFSLDEIAKTFWLWYSEAHWAAHGRVFDIGGTTQAAILEWKRGIPALEAGRKEERSNGNGSLMRILPMAYCHQNLSFAELISRTHQVSCITYAHLRSQMACGIYIAITVSLLGGKTPQIAYEEGLNKITNIYNNSKYTQELNNFHRILTKDISKLTIDEINSQGYVIDTLEAALWCLLNSDSYSQAVLQAVNLGGDTDTTAAVTGGLAGIYYGIDNIPEEWQKHIAQRDDIVNLAERLAQKVYGT